MRKGLIISVDLFQVLELDLELADCDVTGGVTDAAIEAGVLVPVPNDLVQEFRTTRSDFECVADADGDEVLGRLAICDTGDRMVREVLTRPRLVTEVDIIVARQAVAEANLGRW